MANQHDPDHYYTDRNGDVVPPPPHYLVILDVDDITAASDKALDPRLYELIDRLSLFRRAYTAAAFLPSPDSLMHPTGLMYHRRGKPHIVYELPEHLYVYAKVLSLSLRL
jgi:hypothetical protein